MTRKGRNLYLLLSGTAPDGGMISLDMPGYRLLSCHSPEVSCHTKKGTVCIHVPDSLYKDRCNVGVIRLEFDRNIDEFKSAEILTSASYLPTSRAQGNYSYSCFDYYSNYRSTVSYEWFVKSRPSTYVDMFHTEDEIGRNVSLEVDGKSYSISLGSEADVLPMASCRWGQSYYSPMRGGTFNGPAEWKYLESDGMLLLPDGLVDEKVSQFSNHLIVRNVSVDVAGFVLLDICSGNGVELALDGKSFMKHLNPYRTEKRTEKLLVYLEEGEHQLVLRSYNRFADSLCSYMYPVEAALYRTRVELEAPVRSKVCSLKLSAKDVSSPHSDCGLHNIVIRIK